MTFDPQIEMRNLADAVTNSCMQAILAEMKRQGLRGGLGDSRALRREVLAAVTRNIAEPDVTRLAEEKLVRLTKRRNAMVSLEKRIAESNREIAAITAKFFGGN